MPQQLFIYSGDGPPPRTDCPVFLPGWGFDGRVTTLTGSDQTWLTTTRPATPEEILTGLEEMVGEYDLDTLVIAGWSLGAYLALEFARRHPASTTALYLLAPRDHWPRGEIEEIRDAISRDRQGHLQSFFRKCFLGYRPAYRAFQDSLEKGYLDAADLEILEAGMDYLDDIRLDEKMALLDPGIPVYLFRGGKDIIAPMAREPLQSGCFNRVIKHGGHAIFLEQLFSPTLHHRKTMIRRKFSRAAATYDDHATVQQESAGKMAAKLPPEIGGEILELGCGTGFYTNLLVQRYPKNRICSLDFSEGMVEMARRKADNDSVDFLCLDAEKFLQDNCRKFDLVTSNATMQWFDDLSETGRLISESLNPGGLLIATIFGPDGLKELRDGLAAINPEGINLPVDAFPDRTDLQNIFSPFFDRVDIEEWHLHRRYADITALLRHIRRTGVSGPGAGKTVLDRPRMATLGKWFTGTLGECRISYQVFLVNCRKIGKERG